MFGSVRQCGFIPVLQSFGASPLEMWDVKVQNGTVRRVTDEQVRALALEIAGSNVSTCYLSCPRNPRASLGIHMPYLVMIIKSLKKYFTFEVTILDDRNVHRRFRMSNFQKMNRIHHFSTSMPLCLNAGWNEIYFDLSDFTRKAYKTNYVETTRIQVHANCRIRVVYFCDRIYEDKDIPQKFKIFLPSNHICRKTSSEKIEKKDEMVTVTDYGGESEMYEDEFGGAEKMFVDGSIMSLAEEKKGEDEVAPSITTVDEEDEYEDHYGEYPEDDEEKPIKQEEPDKLEAPPAEEGAAEEAEATEG